MELKSCINENGNFNPTKYYVSKFGRIPNSLNLTFNEEASFIDLELITDDILKNAIESIEKIRRSTNKYTTINGAIGKETSSSDLTFNVSQSGTFLQVVTFNKRFYIIDYNSICVKYIDGDEKTIQKELQAIWDKLPKQKPSPKEAIANLVGYSNGDYYTIESKIKRVDIDINEFYNDDFPPVYNDIVKFLESRESGILLFHGPAGTGKTTMLRHLCSKYPRDYIIVPASLTSRLGDPDFVAFMIDNANSVFILEDCEQVLMDRGVNMFNGAISNILNMSDGLLSDIMNIKFICTFNADIKNIDQALLRKGRCYAKYEFKELSADKVRILNDKYQLNIPTIKPMTLADIFNTDKTEYSENKNTRKIGF